MLDHHLDETTVLRYASGDLDAAFTIVVATHLAMCETCRSAVQLAEEIGGDVLAQLESAEIAPTGFEQLMAKIDKAPHIIGDLPAVHQSKRKISGDVPLPLQRYIGSNLRDVSWKFVAPGVRRHVIQPPKGTKGSVYLLHIAPGMAMPEHGHGGAELTLILSGAYADAMGTFKRGDIADLDEHVEHQPRVEGDVPCICLVATEAPTRFKDFFSRLFQPLVGI